MIHINPSATKRVAITFQSRFALGNTSGVKAIPIAAKKAITQDVQPNVKTPSMNDKNGIAFDPFGSIFVKLKLIILYVTMIALKMAMMIFRPKWIITVDMPKLLAIF